MDDHARGCDSTAARDGYADCSCGRIAAGSGTRVQDVNRLLKNYAQVMKMMKKINKSGMRGLGRGMLPF